MHISPYYAEARRILDAMWSKDGTDGIRHVINTEHKQITFVPEGPGYSWTDPSYHLPAFYEVWAEYARDRPEPRPGRIQRRTEDLAIGTLFFPV